LIQKKIIKVTFISLYRHIKIIIADYCFIYRNFIKIQIKEKNIIYEIILKLIKKILKKIIFIFIKNLKESKNVRNTKIL
jgi:hypothetical protein